MADLGITPGDITGTLAVAGLAVKLWWDDREKKRAALEVKAEANEVSVEKVRDEKLELVLSKLTALELEMRSLIEKLSTQTGAVAEVKARVEGISNNHGSRLGTLENAQVELRTRLIALEEKRGRR